ncbi:alpha/beta fold hydrolase [Paraflavisolibacter sp. H34]|uniref:alpha/beta hydrolase n=1 Tax=Huijunlia imazamoxiresistens TaxID=3127457 RepID=UPI00301AF933
MKRHPVLRFMIRGFLVVVVLLNGIAFMHAWRLTHFVRTGEQAGNLRLSKAEMLKMLFLGVDLQRPQTAARPSVPYQVVQLRGDKTLEAWMIRADTAAGKGTIVLFHGYGGEKSGLLPKAMEFRKMGYHTLLVDFRGSGGSEGVQTTIGVQEAGEVKVCYDYLQAQGEKNIHLFGTSMGAVAILKAIHDYGFQPASIFIECPFGSMYQTVSARFRLAGAPSFPLAGLLLFWGGLQNGFWAFSHNPETYAKSVHCPTLLLYGECDPKVSRREIDTIFARLQGPKQLVTYPRAGHESYLLRYRQKWVNDVSGFLEGMVASPPAPPAEAGQVLQVERGAQT